MYGVADCGGWARALVGWCPKPVDNLAYPPCRAFAGHSTAWLERRNAPVSNCSPGRLVYTEADLRSGCRGVASLFGQVVPHFLADCRNALLGQGLGGYESVGDLRVGDLVLPRETVEPGSQALLARL